MQITEVRLTMKTNNPHKSYHNMAGPITRKGWQLQKVA